MTVEKIAGWGVGPAHQGTCSSNGPVLATLSPMEAGVDSRHGLVVWLTAPVYRTPPHPPPPTPRERPLVHDPGYLPGTDRAFPGSQAEVVKVPQHRRQVVHHATLTANSHTTLS